MRPRSLLVLLAVVLAFAAFIWFWERELPGSEAREARAKRLIPGLDVEEVTALEVEQGGEEVRIERLAAAVEGDDEAASMPTGGDWTLAAPARFAGAPADRVAVEGLLSGLAAIEKSRSLASFDREALGLAPPRVRLGLELADGSTIALAVGADLPASSDMVVLAEGTGEAHVVDRTILQDLTRAPGDWRSRQMFAVRRDEVTRITLSAGGGDGRGDGDVVLERDAGRFRLVRPLADLADPTAVQQLLGSLTRLSAERFVDAPGAEPAELGLEPPRGRVTVERTGGPPPVVVEIGAPRPEGQGHTFRVGGQLFVAESDLPEAVSRSPAGWQSLALTSLELYRVDEVIVGGAAPPLHLARSGTEWRRDGEAVSYTPVSDLLFALVEARAEEVAAAGAVAVGDPVLTVELVAAAVEEGGQPERETIAFHAESAGRVPVVVSGRSSVLLLPADELAGIRAELERVRGAGTVAGGEAEELLPEDVEVDREVGF